MNGQLDVREVDGREYVEVYQGEALAWRGNPALVPLLVPLSELSLNPDNARQHHDIEAISMSFKEHGQQQVENATEAGTVLVGNGRLKAATEMGWLLLATVRFTADEIRALNYAIADNRTSERSEWNWETLGDQIPILAEHGFDPLTYGWDQHDLDVILQADWSPPDKESLDGFQRDGSLSVKFSEADAPTIEKAVNRAIKRDGVKYGAAEALVVIAGEWAKP